MTDVTKYRNVSLTHHAYSQLEDLSKVIVPGVKLSISKTVESLAADKKRKLNGRIKPKKA